MSTGQSKGLQSCDLNVSFGDGWQRKELRRSSAVLWDSRTEFKILGGG